MKLTLILQVYKKSEGEFSPRTAEMRADLGKAATDLHVMQTFDGPAPETINGTITCIDCCSPRL